MKNVDPIWLLNQWTEFLRFLKVDLLDFQAEMANGLLTLPQYADVTQTRQSGKSFILGLLIYFLAYTLRWDIIIVAPKIGATEHIMDVVDKIATYLKRKKGIRHSQHSVKKIKISGRGMIKCISGDPFAFVEGNHAHLIVLDEKQDLVKDHIATNILPFRAWFNGLIWSLGIGGDPASWGEHSRAKSKESGNFTWRCPWQRVVKDKPDYQSVVDDIRDSMLPAQFRAHMECEELDMSSHILIKSIKPYGKLPEERAHITIGLDFGAIDKTIATVNHLIGPIHYFTEWMVLNGDYSVQTDQLVHWLKEVVEYDTLIGEDNGVGGPVIDFLNAKGLNVVRWNANQKKNTVAAHKIMTLASKEKLQYNPNHELSTVFYNDVTKLNYKMTSIHDVKVDHSDFYSSGILTLFEAPKMRIAV